MLGLATATSSPALAEDGLPDVPVPSVPAAAEVTTAMLEDVGLPELEPMTAVDSPAPLPAVTAQPTAVEPVTEGAVAAPPPVPVVEAPVQTASVEADEPDAVPAPDAPVVEQTAPTNVNVSVRVDSAGDNGPVAQVNVAGIADELDPSRYQPEVPQYQAPIPDAPPEDDPSTPEQTAALAESSDASWNWTWTWDCGSQAPAIPIPSGTATLNWNWNWDWNCDDPQPPPGNTATQSPPQYQPGVTQYRPININISIRINSPGNDGPVVQTNVAVAVVPPVVMQTPIVQLPVALPVPAPSSGAPPGEPAAAVTATTQILAWFDAGVDELGLTLLEPECCVLQRPRGVSFAELTPQNALLPPQLPVTGPDITAPERFRASVAVTTRLTKAAETAARAERASSKPVRTLRPAPPRPKDPARAPALVRSASGFAPLNASDGRLGWLVAAVLGFAFVIAFAQSARSVAAEVRVAGEDPDPPPTRPG